MKRFITALLIFMFVGAVPCGRPVLAQDTAMGSFKDDEGRPLNVTPNGLMVGVALRDVANTLYTADRLEDGKVNLYKGLFKPIVSPRITSPTAWFLLDTTKPVKPFIYQERKSPVFVQQTDPQADDVFNKKKFKFGTEARAASGYGFWQMIFGSTGLLIPEETVIRPCDEHCAGDDIG